MPFDLFVSYAHADNERDHVRELLFAIAVEFRQFAGRDLRSFFDEDDIPSMADWEWRIGQALRESHLFLAVLSPRYFASPYCQREWEEFVRYEAMRQCLGEGIVPVYFVELPGLDGPGVDRSIAAAVAEMRKRQWCDLVSQRPVKILPWYEVGKRALDDSEVVHRLTVLREQISDRLERAERGQRSNTNIYRHNPQFVGRVRELTLLREALDKLGSVGVVGASGADAQRSTTGTGATAVHGLGGMGKTELALAYAHAFAWDYPGGRWLVSCEGLGDFDLALRQLAAPNALNITFTEEEQRIPRRAGDRVIAELRRRERALLLLDNVSRPELLAPDVLMRLPPPAQLHLLATTRLGRAQLAGSAHDHSFVAVDELLADDALALLRAHQPLRRFVSEGEEKAARELVGMLKGFTLAVETAAVYLGRQVSDTAVEEYTVRLRPDLLGVDVMAGDQGVAVRHKEKLLERTLAITFETLTAEQFHVLAIGALLPPDQVALSWLRVVAAQRFSHLGHTGESTASDAWSNVEAALTGFRLLTPGPDTRIMRIHRMVQLLVARRASAHGTPPGSETSFVALDDALARHILDRGDYLSEGWEQQTTRWELQPLQGTAAMWLDAKRHSGYELALRLVVPLHVLALYPEAERLARQALEYAEREYPDDSTEIARSANTLGVALKAANRIPEAEENLRRAMEIDERRFGPRHPEVAIDLGNLGVLLHHAGRSSEAKALLERAVAILEEAPHPDPKALVCALSGLGQIVEDEHRLRDAEIYYRRALTRAEAAFGRSHYLVGEPVGNLSSLMKKMNSTAEAEELTRRSLEIAEAMFGRKHPSFAVRLNNLAEILREADRFAEAEPLYKEALATIEELMDPRDPARAQVLNNLGILYRETGRLEQAEQHYRRALAIWEDIFSKAHPDVSAGMGNLATLLRQLGKYAEAEDLFRQAMAIDESLFGAENPHLAPILSNLAGLLCDLKQFDEAESLSRRQLTIVARASEREQSDHAYLRIAAGNYFDLLRRIGLTEQTARTRVDQVLQGSGFSSFDSSIAR